VARLTIDDVYEHCKAVCFKNGPPGTVGAETEWLVVDPRDPSRPIPPAQWRDLLATAGFATGDALPGGSVITAEPGGQLEVSSAPYRYLSALHTALAGDLDIVESALRAGGLALSGQGVDPVRRPLLHAEGERYRCMDAYFGAASRNGHAAAPRRGRGTEPRRGIADHDHGWASDYVDAPGPAMMCTTASVQVCLDIGADTDDAAARWQLAHRLSPILVASFANSPLHARSSGPHQPTGLKSTRQAIWSGLDPGRTSAPSGQGDPAAEWARYALDAQVMLIRSDTGPWTSTPGFSFREWLAMASGPTLADFDYHLSTLFPPIRPRGWLELRMIDALPMAYWPVAVAVATALIDDPIAADVAAEAVEPFAAQSDIDLRAARDALADPAIDKAARTCFDAAGSALIRLGASSLRPVFDDYRTRYVDRGRCPADDVLDGVQAGMHSQRRAA
jgi:glutamate--cysteine ligase